MAITKKPAQNFSYSRDLSGAYMPAVLQFDIATTTAIERGEVVKLTEAKVVAVSGDTTAVLGVSKDPHDGSSDGQKGTKIAVYVSPTAVFKCTPATTFTASASTTTNAIYCTALAGVENGALNGGYVKVLTATTKALEGTVIAITDFVKANGVITAAGAFTAGDTFLVFPPVGSQAFCLDSDGTNLDLTDDAGTIVTIVSTDPYDSESVEVMFSEHVFGSVKS